jgi:hypothetical protein
VDKPLSLWTVYDHPRDFPKNYVARRHEIHSGRVVPTDDLLICSELAAIRENLAERGLTVLPRQPQDDPVIVEVWL